MLAVALAGCSGATSAERSRGSEPCEADATALRLWTFSLSHPDTVTLKNTSACPVELEGVELHFDDRDEAFAERTALDCTVRLPALELEGGASARVSELPFPGEIDALTNEVAGCAYPLSFNPDRGGVTYLCDGPCDASTLIDAVAHFGDDWYPPEPGVVNPYRDPPPMRFGASFADPVWGTSLHNDGLVRYQRVTTTGAYPAFVGGDWGLASRVLFADFEDGVCARAVQSSPGPWGVIPGEAAQIVTTTETAASFATSLRLRHDGQDGASVALSWPIDDFSTPRDLSYFARVATHPVKAANLELFAGASRIVTLGFDTDGVGATSGGARVDEGGEPNVWYRIELRDIGWRAGEFDHYVNGAVAGRALRLPEHGGPVDEIRLGSFSAGSVAHFDALELWGEPYSMGPAPTENLGVARCGVPSEDATPPSGPICADIDGPGAGGATCESFCSAWDAICCGEPFAENYPNRDACLAACATFTASELCCRAAHGRVGGPERCRYALGLEGVCDWH